MAVVAIATSKDFIDVDISYDRNSNITLTDDMAQLGLGGRHPLFCTLAGSRIGDAYIRVLLPRLARKAGIDTECGRPVPGRTGALT